MKHQRGHMSFEFMYWFAAILGAILTSGGGWLLWISFLHFFK